MRSIILHIYDDDCLEACLQVALDLARSFKGHITCVQPIVWTYPGPGDFMGESAAELLPIIRENAAKLQQKIEGRLADEGVAWDWLQDFDPAGDLLRAYGALADLIVLGARDPVGGKGASSLAGQLAIHAQTPVLVVPATARSFDVTMPAIVAWNGSIEASHALRAAVPLLSRAASVHLISVEETGTERTFDLPPTEGAEFLSRHGIECEMVEIPRSEGSAQDVLRRAAATRKAGLIVMGAYGHSRIREIILGGVTRDLLSTPPVPLLLSH